MLTDCEERLSWSMRGIASSARDAHTHIHVYLFTRMQRARSTDARRRLPSLRSILRRRGGGCRLAGTPQPRLPLGAAQLSARAPLVYRDTPSTALRLLGIAGVVNVCP